MVRMGIKFRCQECQKKLHVKSFLAGKRGICPECGARFVIPEENAETAEPVKQKVKVGGPTDRPVRTKTGRGSDRRSGMAGGRSNAEAASAPTGDPGRSGKRKAVSADALTEVPDAVWYVRPPGGGQYGPADAAIMRRWLDEGRVGADSYVWREGWPDWQEAGPVFPQLKDSSPVDLTEVNAGEASDFTLTAERPTPTRPTHGGRRAKNQRNIAVLVILALVCAGLLAALIWVLNNQS